MVARVENGGISQAAQTAVQAGGAISFFVSPLLFFIVFSFFKNLFIFGHARSSLLLGAFSSCGAWASLRWLLLFESTGSLAHGLSSWNSQALEFKFSSWGAWA